MTSTYEYATIFWKQSSARRVLKLSMNECEPKILEIELCGGVGEVGARLVEVAVGTADLVGGP